MKYMLILVGDEAEKDQVAPEDMEAVMGAWDDYWKALEEANAVIAGEGLQPSATATTVKHEADGERIVSDGPFAETKEQVGGFYLLECDNLDEALEWAKKVPLGQGTVEVRPVMDYSEHGYDDQNEKKAAAS